MCIAELHISALYTTDVLCEFFSVLYFYVNVLLIWSNVTSHERHSAAGQTLHAAIKLLLTRFDVLFTTNGLNSYWRVTLIDACVFERMYVYICVCMYLCCLYMCVCVFVHVYVCVCAPCFV